MKKKIETYKGQVKYFNVAKMFGSIKRDDNEQGIIFLQQDVEEECYLQQNDRVVFQIGDEGNAIKIIRITEEVKAKC